MPQNSKYRFIFNAGNDLEKESQYSWARPSQNVPQNPQDPQNVPQNQAPWQQRWKNWAQDFYNRQYQQYGQPFELGYQYPMLNLEEAKILRMSEQEWRQLPGNEQKTTEDYRNERARIFDEIKRFKNGPNWLYQAVVPRWLRNMLQHYITKSR